MTYTYKPKGVCSQKMQLEVEDAVIKDLQVTGGCNGNLKGIAELLKGMKVEDAIQRLEGIRCGSRSTSCPDQIARALKKMQARQQAM